MPSVTVAEHAVCLVCPFIEPLGRLDKPGAGPAQKACVAVGEDAARDQAGSDLPHANFG